MVRICDSAQRKPRNSPWLFSFSWEQRKLGETCEITTGGTPTTSIFDYWNPKEIPWLSSGEVHKKRIFVTDDKISRKGLENSSTRWIKPYSVLIALAGQGKTRGTVAINEIALTTNQSIAAIYPTELNAEFLFQNLESRYDELRGISSADGSRGGLNKHLLSDIFIPYAEEHEQAKIGSFFRALDDLITLHQRKHLSFNDPRKKYSFSGKTIAWEQRKLGEIADIIGGGTPSTSVPNYWDGDIDWYAPAEMEGQRYAAKSIRKITEEGLKNSSARMLPAGNTILFTSRAGIGKMAILQRPAATNQGFQSIVLNDGIATYFIYSMGSILKKKAEGIASGSTFLEISGKMLGNIDIMIPRLPEQQKIGTFFRALDDLITLHQRKPIFQLLEVRRC